MWVKGTLYISVGSFGVFCLHFRGLVTKSRPLTQSLCSILGFSTFRGILSASPTSLGSGFRLWRWGWGPPPRGVVRLGRERRPGRACHRLAHGLYLTHTVAVFVVVVMLMGSCF